MYLKAYHHRSPQLSWRYAVTNWLFVTFRCCDSMQAIRGNQYDLCMTLLTLFEQKWMETTSSTHLYKSRLMKTNVFFMSWNPLRLSQSLQSTMLTCIYCNFPSNMAKGWKIQYLQLYIHAKSAWFPRIVQENHQLSATFYCYVLVVTQWFIIIQLLLSLPMPGHTLITPFAVGQTQVCCGQLIKYSDCRHGYLFRSFLEWRSTPKIGDGHLTFHVAFLQSAYKPHIFTGKTRNIIISSKLTPSFLAYSLEKHGTWKSPLKRNIIISSKPSFLACHVNFFFRGVYFWGWWVHPQAPNCRGTNAAHHPILLTIQVHVVLHPTTLGWRACRRHWRWNFLRACNIYIYYIY